MEKVLIILALALTQLPVAAQHHNYHHGDPGRWLAPLIVGGVVGYAVSKNSNTTAEKTVIQQSGVIVVQTQHCTAWQEIVRHDGSVLRQRTCSQ